MKPSTLDAKLLVLSRDINKKNEMESNGLLLLVELKQAIFCNILPPFSPRNIEIMTKVVLYQKKWKFTS